jgi:hypothetical protein
MENGTIALSLSDSPYFIWRMCCEPSFLTSVTNAPMVLIRQVSFLYASWLIVVSRTTQSNQKVKVDEKNEGEFD